MAGEAEKYAQWLVQNADKRGTPEFEIVANAYQQSRAQPAETGRPIPPENAQAGLPEDNAIGRAIEGPSVMGELGRSAKDFFTGLYDEPERVIDGLLDPVYGAYQLGTNVGDMARRALPDDIEESIYGQAPFYGETVNEQMQARDEYLGGNSAERLAGNVLSGGALVKGAPGFINNVKDALKVSLTMPAAGDDFWSEKGTQTAWGVGTGGALGLAQKAASLSPGMIRENARKWILEALERGGRSADDAHRALTSNTDDLATAGQVLSRGGQRTAAGSNEVIGLEKIARSKHPTPFSDRYAEQAQRRTGKLREAFGTEDDIASALASRSSTTGPMYSEALDLSAVPDRELRGILEDPFVQRHIQSAKDLLESDTGVKIGSVLKPEQVSRFLHYVGRAMRDSIDNTSEGARLGPETRKATSAARTKLLSWLDEANPDYGKARSTFSDMSRPIERMEVGQEISNKVIPALDEYGSFSMQSGNPLARALREGKETILKRNTTGKVPSLDEVVGDDGMRVLKDTATEMADQASYTSMGNSGASAARAIINSRDDIRLPGMLERSVLVINSLLSRLGLATKENTLEYFAEISLDPKKYADLLKQATGQERQALEQMKKALPVIAATIGSERN